MYKVSVTKHGVEKFGSTFNTEIDAKTWIANQTAKNSWGKPEAIMLVTEVVAGMEVIEKVKGPMGIEAYKVRIPADYEVVITEQKSGDTPEDMFKKLRKDREDRLAACDKTQLADYPMDSKDKAFWREYRQYLRDMPLYYSDLTVHDYVIMEFKKWKKWKHNK